MPELETRLYARLIEIKRTSGSEEMKRSSGFRNFLLVGFLVLGCGTLLLAQDSAGQNAPSSDNTQMNQHDRTQNESTADQQQNNRSDLEITQQVRKAIEADKSFSKYAHNVKVITQNGQVTLKGPVRSEEEKHAVEAKAADVAGEGKVTSELTVKPKS
jgi:osmotically-inducible protein OsmY